MDNDEREFHPEAFSEGIRARRQGFDQYSQCPYERGGWMFRSFQAGWCDADASIASENKTMNLTPKKIEEIESDVKAALTRGEARLDPTYRVLHAVLALIARIREAEKSKKELNFTKGTLVQYFGENKWSWTADEVVEIISHTHFGGEELQEAITSKKPEETEN